MKEKFKKFFAPTKFKRLFDIVVSFFALIILSPLFLVICIANLLTPNTSVFFSHERRGRKGKPFKIYKFQTMKNNTPNVATGDLENPEQYITKVGKFLRKTSLDELPQLWNIARGDMAVIGPRPALWNQTDLIAERDKYGANDVTPGLTGWAQINGRDELEIPVKAKLDGEYVKKYGFTMDVRCFFGTFLSVLRQDGVVEGGTGSMKGK